MTAHPPIRVAVIGMGGFASVHHDTLLKLESLGQSRLIATCDPRPEAFAAQRTRWRFADRGVRVFADCRELLAACAAELDLVVIPTPIPLHAEMHRVAVEHGVPVYLEKPPTLDPVELEAMIATDRAAKKTTVVGFNFIVEKPRLALKQRILDGEFGRLLGVGLLAQWPRPASYFQRNDWAGRLRSADGRLILDSCFANAMAHYVHNVLHWAGPAALFDWAAPDRVRAELYRGHDIEGADTIFAEAETDTGVPLRIALTHACPEPHVQHETLRLEKATVDYVVDSHYTVNWHDGRVERAGLPPFVPLIENHLDHYRYLRGETDRPSTRLEDCRPFVRFNALNYVSSGEITAFPADLLHRLPEGDDGQNHLLEVDGLAPAMEAFVAAGVWPGASGVWPRQRPAATVKPEDVSRLETTVSDICLSTTRT